MTGKSDKLPISLARVKGGRVQKPRTKKKSPSQNKDGSNHKSPTSIFGPHAVTRYLHIPQTGNITGVELTVFLPELLRTPGVLFRFLQNGGDAQTLAKISTWFRATVKDHHTPATAANAMRHITQSTMRRFLQKDKWTETRHKAGLYDEPGQVWDHDNLTFAGVRNFCEDTTTDGRHKRPSIPNVRFASLAIDVVAYPSGDDELDLTRCVKAAAANEELPLMFPRDYGYLTRLLGGPQPVRHAHRDGELFNRWRQVTWAEASSERQDETAWNNAHFKFTAAQKAATEEYLRNPASTEQPASSEIERPMDTPMYAQDGPYASPFDDDPLATFIQNVTHYPVEPPQVAHGPPIPIAHDAEVMMPTPDALSSMMAADIDEWWPPSEVNWDFEYYSHPVTPVDMSLIDPEILRTSNFEVPGFTDPNYSMNPPQAGLEIFEADPVNFVEDTPVEDPFWLLPIPDLWSIWQPYDERSR